MCTNDGKVFSWGKGDRGCLGENSLTILQWESVRLIAQIRTLRYRYNWSILFTISITLILEKHFPPTTWEPLPDPDFRTRWYGWKKRAPTDSNPTLYGDRARERGALSHLTRQQWRRGVHVWVRIQGTTRHGEQLWCYSTSCSRCLWISKNGAKSRHSFYFSYISL